MRSPPPTTFDSEFTWITCPGAAPRSDGPALALVAQVGVHAILQHEQVALHRQLGQALPALGREVHAHRVLARGLQRAQPHLVAGQHLLQRVHVQAVGVHRDADHARARGRAATAASR